MSDFIRTVSLWFGLIAFWCLFGQIVLSFFRPATEDEHRAVVEDARGALRDYGGGTGLTLLLLLFAFVRYGLLWPLTLPGAVKEWIVWRRKQDRV